jgi:hypothetical protein
MSTLLKIDPPKNNDLAWSDLTPDLRDHVRVWRAAFQQVGMIKPIAAYFEALARYTGSTAGTAKRHYYACQAAGSWHPLVPKNKLPRPALDCRTNNREFRAHLIKIVEEQQRNNRTAFRKLRAQWRNREIIPGYTDLPGYPSQPVGWSDRNLDKIVGEETNKARLNSIRLGVSSKTNDLLPQVFTTRVGLYPGAVYQIDDMWHDNFVTVGKSRTPARVIELGALDLFSACRFKWGAKPRLRNEETGSFNNLNEADTRFFIAGLFADTGYSPRGTMLMLEHGTAALREDVERILYDASGGLIRCDRQPIEGKQQALTQYWGGTEGGNFRAKASLESIHNRIHNDLANLSLQTGKDAGSRPVTTDRQLQYITGILKSIAKVAPERLDLLKLPALDFHTQFIPLLQDYYTHGLNNRTDHALQGWAELGHLVTEYTTLPGSEQFLSAAQFLALPDDSQAIISGAAKSDPQTWTRKRNLSPAEVWKPALGSMLKLPDYILGDILSQDLAREEKVKGSFFKFRDQGTTDIEHIYEARIYTPEGAVRELPHGEKFQVFANPFSPRWLQVHNARGQYLGKCELYKRVQPLNLDAFHDANPWEERTSIRSAELTRAAGDKHARIAEQHEGMRHRHTERVTTSQDLREFNRKVIAGAPVTDAEIAAARSVSGHKANATRNAKKAAESNRTGMSFKDLL